MSTFVEAVVASNERIRPCFQSLAQRKIPESKLTRFRSGDTFTPQMRSRVTTNLGSLPRVACQSMSFRLAMLSSFTKEVSGNARGLRNRWSGLASAIVKLRWLDLESQPRSTKIEPLPALLLDDVENLH